MKKAAITTGATSFLLGAQLLANPTGASVVSGDVSVAQIDAHHMRVESRSEKSIIDWEDFSIGQSEAAYFQLPSGSSAVLNRVSSNLSSTIAGSLSSNGYVYLINPNGILVTEEGTIDTASFLASTLDVDSGSFLLDGEMFFAGASQEGVINKGTITASNGDVILLGYTVRNENTVNALQGVAALGAGNQIFVTPAADQRITIVLPEGNLGSGIGVQQSGWISALQTELKAAGNAYALAIDSSGYIHATGVEKNNGRVYLIGEGGLVSHTGQITAEGSDVQILGERVALTEMAVVDVSSDFGGGSILVGGDFKNLNPNILTAEHAFVEDGVVLSANARMEGNGGKIIVWGLESSGFFGYASAQGGALAGNGGLVEVSSMRGLVFEGMANTLAAQGTRGTLLLDPTDITIVTGGAGLVLNGMNCFTNTYCAGCTGLAMASIDPTVITTALMTNSVFIDASAGAASGTGSITVTNGLTMTTGNNLTLIALTNVAINDNLTNSGSGALNIYGASFYDGAAMNGIGTGAVLTEINTIQSGTITIAAGVTVSLTGSGSINMFCTNSDTSDAITVNGSLTNNGTGLIKLNTFNGGDIHFSSTGILTTQNTGNIQLASHNDIIFDSGSTIQSLGNSGSIFLTAGNSLFGGTGSVLISGTISYPMAATGSFNASSNATTSLGLTTFNSVGGAFVAFGTLALNTTDVFTIGDDVTTGGNSLGSSVIVSIGNSAGDTLSVTPTMMGAGLSINSGSGGTTFTGTATVSNAGALSITGNNIAFNNDVNILNTATVTATAPSIEFNGMHTLVFNSSGTSTFSAPTGFHTITIGDGANAFALNGLGTGTLIFDDSNATVTLSDLATITWTGSNTLTINADLVTDTTSNITFNMGSGPFNLNGGFNIGGTLAYHTSSLFTGASSTDAMTIGTTGVVTFDGGGTVNFTSTGALINFLNTAMNSFVVSGATVINITNTDGNIAMGPAARFNYTATNPLTIETTGNGSVSFDGTSIFTFAPSAGTQTLTIQATGAGDVSLGSIVYNGTNTGLASILSATGTVGVNSMATLSWAAGSGGLVLNGSDGVTIDGGITYSSTTDLDIVAAGVGSDTSISSTGTITMNAGAGSLNIGTVGTPLGGTFSSNGMITMNSGAAKTLSIIANGNVDPGNISYGSTGNATITAQMGGNLNTGSGETITMTAAAIGGQLNMTGDAVTLGGNITTVAGSTGDVTITAATSGFVTSGDFTFGGSGTVSFNATVGSVSLQNTTLIGFSGAGGNFNINANGMGSNIAIDATLNFGSGGAFAFSANNGVNLSGPITNTSSTTNTITSLNADINQSNLVTFSFTGPGNLTATSTNGNVNFNGNSTFSSTGVLTLNGQYVNLGGINSFTGSSRSVFNATANDLNMYGSGTYTQNSTNMTNSIWTSANNMNLNVPLNFSGGTSSLTATSNTGDVSISNTLDFASTNAMTFQSTSGNVQSDGSLIHSFMNSGTFSMLAPGAFASVNQGSPMTFDSGAGSCVMTADGIMLALGTITFNTDNDLTITSTSFSIINNGMLTANSAGTVSYIADVDMLSTNNHTNSGTGDLIITVGNGLRFESAVGGQGSVNWTGPVTINAGMITMYGDATSANIAATTGPVDITTTDNLIMLGPSQIDGGTMGYNLMVGGSLSVRAQANSIITGTSGSITVADDIYVIADSGGLAEITATGAVSATSTGGSIYVVGFDSVNTASINSSMGGTVTVTTSGGTGNIVVRDFGSITATADISLVATGSVTIDNAASVDNSGSGGKIEIGTTAVPIGTNIFLNGGPDGPAEVNSGSAGLTLSAGDAIMTSGVSGVNNAQVLAPSGFLRFQSGTSIIMDNYTAVSTTAGAALITFTASEDIFIGGNCSVTHNGAGGIAFSASADITMLAIGGNSTVSGGSGATSVSAEGRISLLSGPTGAAQVIGTGNVTLSGSNILLAGMPGQTAHATSSTGILTAQSTGDVVLLDNAALNISGMANANNIVLSVASGDVSVINGSTISHGGTGAITSTGNIGGSLLVRSGTLGASSITAPNAGSSITLGVVGDIHVTAISGGNASVTSNGAISLTSTANQIYLTGNTTPTFTATVSSTSGLITLSGVGGISLLDRALVSSGSTGAAISFVTANNVRIENSASVLAGAAGGSIAIGTVGTRVGALYFTGGVTGPSLISTTTGALSIFATNAIVGNGTTAVNNGKITTTSGVLTVNSSQSVILDTFSTITTTGGLAAFTVIGAQDVYVGGNCTINNSGTGPTVITATNGEVNVIGGPAAAAISLTTGGATITSGKKMNVLSGNGGAASITATGAMNIVCGDALTVAGIFQMGAGATIQSTSATNSITFTVTNDMNVMDNATVGLTLAGSGNVNLTVGQDLNVLNGSTVLAGTGSVLTPSPVGGSILVRSGPGGPANITSNAGQVNMQVVRDINVESSTGGVATIGAGTGNSLATTNGAIKIIGTPGSNSASVNGATVDLQAGVGVYLINNGAALGSTSVAITNTGEVMLHNSSILFTTAMAGSISIGTMMTPVTGTVYVQGGPAGGSSITAGTGGITLFTAEGLVMDAASGGQALLLSNGLTSITSDTITMMGDSTMVRASITGLAGGMTITSGLTTLNNHSTIQVTGGMGAMTLTLSDDLIVANDSDITNTGSGALNITSTGSATLLAGAGNALITTATTGSVVVTGNINVLSDLTGSAQVTATSDLDLITSGGNIYVIGSPLGSQAASVTSGGVLTVMALGNVMASDLADITVASGAGNLSITATLGNLIVNNGSVLQNLGTGDVIGVIGTDVVITAGADGDSAIASEARVDLTIGGDLDIQALSSNAAFISADSGMGTTSIAADRITLIGQTALAYAQILNNTGAMTVSGSYVSLTDNATIIIGSGSGTLTVNTLADLNIANSSSIRNSGTGALTSMIGGTAYIEGGPLGAASFAGGTGGASLTASSAFLTGFASGMTTNTGSVTALGGGLTLVTTVGTLTLNNHANVTLTAGAVAMAITVAEDLLVTNDAIILNSGTGTTTVGVTGDATFLAGGGQAKLQGGTGNLSLTATDNISLLSDTSDIASIIGGGQITVTSSKDVIMHGSPTGAKQALVQSTAAAATVTVTGAQNVHLFDNARITSAGSGTLTVNATTGNLTLQNQSSIQQTGTGAVSLTIGANALIVGGPNGNAFIQSPVGLTLALNGALTIQAQSNSTGASSFTGFIQSAGVTAISANKITMTGVSSSFPAFIKTTTGTLAITTTGAIDMADNAQIELSAAGTTINMIVGGDLRVSNGSTITNLGTGLTTTTVTGNLFIEGGMSGGAAVKGGSGGLTASASSIQMNGFSPVFNGLLTTTSGTLTTSTVFDTVLNPNANITVQGGAGNLIMGVGQMMNLGSLTVSDNGLIRNLGTGNVQITATGEVNVLAGSSNATIQSNAGGITITAADAINILSDKTGAASVQSTGPVSVSSSTDIAVIGSPAGAKTAFIQTGAAANPTLAISATNTILLRNNANVTITTGSGTLTFNANDVNLENKSLIQQQGAGAITSTIGGDLLILSGPVGGSSITTNLGMTMSVTGDMRMLADANGAATISTKGATSITAGRLDMIGFSATAGTSAAVITNTTGNLTVSASAIDMIDFAQILLTGGSGTLAVNATASELRIANGSVIQNSGTGPTTSMVTDTLFIEGGRVNVSKFVSGTGGLTVTANALEMIGYSSGNGALLSTTSGGLSVTTTATTNLNPYSTISLTSAASANTLSVNSGSDLLVANGSTILNSGTGTTTVSSGGVVNVIGGLGDAVIQGHGALTLTSSDTIHILADKQGMAKVTSSGNVTVLATTMMTTGGSVYVIGAPQASVAASITSTGGSVSVTADNGIAIEDLGTVAVTAGSGTVSLTTNTGDLVLVNGATVSGLTGTLTGSINKDAIIKSGPAGNSSISNTGVMNFTVGRDLNVEATTNNNAFLSCSGTGSTVNAGRIYLVGVTPMQQGYLQNNVGTFAVSAASVHLLDFAKIALGASGTTLNVSATAGELRLSNGSLIQNSGSGLTTCSVNSTLYVEGGSSTSGQSAVKGGNGGLTITAAQILMNGFSGTNNALIQAANGNLGITTTGMISMTPNSKIALAAGAGSLTIMNGGTLYRTTATSTITSTGSLVITGATCTSCL